MQKQLQKLVIGFIFITGTHNAALYSMNYLVEGLNAIPRNIRYFAGGFATGFSLGRLSSASYMRNYDNATQLEALMVGQMPCALIGIATSIKKEIHDLPAVPGGARSPSAVFVQQQFNFAPVGSGKIIFDTRDALFFQVGSMIGHMASYGVVGPVKNRKQEEQEIREKVKAEITPLIEAQEKEKAHATFKEWLKQKVEGVKIEVALARKEGEEKGRKQGYEQALKNVPSPMYASASDERLKQDNDRFTR